MRVYKIFFLSLFAALYVFGASPNPTALAATPTPTPASITIGTNGAASIKGNGSQITTSGMVLSSWGKEWNIVLTSTTKLLRKSGVASFLGEFREGDYLDVRGTMNAEGVINAATIYNLSNLAGRATVSGVLSELTPTTFKVLYLTTVKNVSYTATIPTTLDGLIKSTASLKNGMKVNVTGIWDRDFTLLTAISISATTPPVSVTITPNRATVSAGNTQQFTASVTGIGGTGVTWMVKGIAGGDATVGTISGTGLYTPPANVTVNVSLTITAKSVADPTKIGSAYVTLTATDTAPTGWQDSADCTVAVGWSCDANDYARALSIQFYKDASKAAGGVSIGSVTANVARESAVGAACGNNANHGYRFTIPTSLKDGRSHDLYAYAVNVGPAGSAVVTLLSGSPKNISCGAPPPPPPPSLSRQ